MILYIRNMVCNRCVIVVKMEPEKLSLQTAQVNIEEVLLIKASSSKRLQQLIMKVLRALLKAVVIRQKGCCK